MTSVSNCPECHGQLQVPDEFLGRKVKCPTCGAQFIAARAGVTEPTSMPGTETAPQRRPPLPDDEDDDDYDDRPRRRRRRHGEVHRGTTVLVIGILSIVFGGFGLILGPIAWVMGNTDLRKIRSGEMDPEGESLTKAGWVCGIIGTFLGLCNCVFVIGYFVFFMNMVQGGRFR